MKDIEGLEDIEAIDDIQDKEAIADIKDTGEAILGGNIEGIQDISYKERLYMGRL